MDRRAFARVLAAAAAAVAAPRAAFADDVGDVLGAITKARASVKTLVAPFTQERTIGLLSTVVKSDGEMTLVLPDRLRWELKPPDSITYWVTPEGFAFATPKGGASVGKGGAGRFALVLGDLLILMGGDLEKLRQRYQLSVDKSDAGVTIVARPLAEDVAKLVKSLEMRVGPELWTVQRIVIEEKGGDRSVVAFGKVTRDAHVDPDKMKPPKS